MGELNRGQKIGRGVGGLRCSCLSNLFECILRFGLSVPPDALKSNSHAVLPDIFSTVRQHEQSITWCYFFQCL